MKQPFINLEEPADRFVGRRIRTPDAMKLESSRKADAVQWREVFGGLRVPRGVYRFRTHDEADAWLWRMITRPRT